MRTPQSYIMSLDSKIREISRWMIGDLKEHIGRKAIVIVTRTRDGKSLPTCSIAGTLEGVDRKCVRGFAGEIPFFNGHISGKYLSEKIGEDEIVSIDHILAKARIYPTITFNPGSYYECWTVVYDQRMYLTEELAREKRAKKQEDT